MFDTMCDFIKENISDLTMLNVGGLFTILGIIITHTCQRIRDILMVNINRRTEIYSNTLTLLEKLKYNKEYFYDEKVIESLFEIKSKIKLFASKNVCLEFEKIWNFIMEVYGSYKSECKRLDQLYNSDDDNALQTETDVDNYIRCISNYKDQNSIDSDQFNNLIKNIIKKMQNDLKT